MEAVDGFFFVLVGDLFENGEAVDAGMEQIGEKFDHEMVIEGF